MNLDFHSHKTQLVVTAVAASAATIGVISAYNQYTRRTKRQELDRHILRSVVSKPGESARSAPPSPITLNSRLPPPYEIQVAGSGSGYDEDLVREHLARNYAFFGDEGMSKIRKGKVVVVGCGGVGSWAAVMLVRSYVSLPP